MAPLPVAVLFMVFVCITRSDNLVEETSDTIALLKCEIEELKRDYKDVKDENRQLRKRLDTLESEKDITSAHNARQDKIIADTRRQVSFLSSRCSLLSPGVCGNCTCVDDYKSDAKYVCDCRYYQSKRDCVEHYNEGRRVSGLYRIHSNHARKMEVYCDQKTDGGGWAVIQRRIDGTTSFYRDWKSYKDGFGTPYGNLWLGLENIYALIMQAIYPRGTELRIDMQHWSMGHLFAKYKSFRLDGERNNYTMYNDGFSGNTENWLSYHNGLPFATYDRGNDCPLTVRSAWWFGHCSTSDLNAEYVLRDDPMPGMWRGITWGTWTNLGQLKYSDMKIRRIP